MMRGMLKEPKLPPKKVMMIVEGLTWTRDEVNG